MRIQQEQTLTLTHEETLDVLKRGLKSKFKRKTIGKGIDGPDVTVKFNEEVDESTSEGTGRLVSCEIVMPPFEEEITEEVAEEEAATA